MNRSLSKVGQVIIVILVFVTVALAASYTTTTTGGNWTTGSTWSGGSAPANWGNHTAAVQGDITVNTSDIQGFTAVNLNNGISFTRGTSSSSANLNLQSITNFNVNNGNIVVYGNLTLNATTMTITSGSLTVTGTLTLSNGAVINYNSNSTSSVGAFTTSGSGGAFNLNSGTLNITNSLTLASNGSLTIDSDANATAGSLTINNSGSASLTNSGSFTVNGNVTQGGSLTNNGTMQVNGNLTSSGSGTSLTTNNGDLNITGNVTMPSSGKIQVNPGASTIVDGNVNVSSNENLVVGTAVAPPPYADMVIKGNISSTSSGDIKVDQNGRLAVFGDITATGGGTFFTINNGGEVYVDGDVTFTGGGSQIINNNTTDPYGLYVNGTITNSGGGSSTTPNVGDRSDLESTNPDFFEWIASQPGSPLPVTLLFFQVKNVTVSGVHLSWATATELNFDYFSLERSADGILFQEVARIPGHGNSTERTDYSFDDLNPVVGKSYYRLVSVDFDGYSETFDVIAVNYEGEKKLSVYPNPVVDSKVTLEFNFVPGEEIVVSIIDLNGMEVVRKTELSSLNEFYLNIQPGTYLLRVSSDEFMSTSRIVVK